MAAKKKLLEFDSDFDDIDGSMHSSELSELDSDVHSLSSLRSCAQSWIEDVEYKAPAEGWVKFATPAAMVRSWMRGCLPSPLRAGRRGGSFAGACNHVMLSHAWLVEASRPLHPPLQRAAYDDMSI